MKTLIKTLWIVLALTMASGLCRADDFFSHKFRVKIGKPLAGLATHVQAPSGNVTLFADFERKTDKGVPLYIINRSGKSLDFNAEDGYLYHKLESRNAQGQWVRAQTHQFSGCGNSYDHTPVLQTDHFSVSNGYIPASGTKTTVRYSFYLQDFKLSSNAGPGLVDEKEIATSAFDSLAMRSGNQDFVTKVAVGTIRLEQDERGSVRRMAIWKLADDSFDRAAAKKTLTRIANSKVTSHARYAKMVLKLIADKENKARKTRTARK